MYIKKRWQREKGLTYCFLTALITVSLPRENILKICSKSLIMQEGTKKISKDIWESNKSLDGKRLLAMTFLTSPVVTFYRADVMEENGFPSEPEELAKFIEKSEILWL